MKQWMLRSLALGILCSFLTEPALAQGGPKVTIVNTPLPVEATEAQTAFVASAHCVFGAQPSAMLDRCQIEPLYTVPPGTTAVIESASGVCVTQPGTATREFQLSFTGPGGAPVQLSFPPSPAVSAGGASTAGVNIAVSVTAQNLKSYASGGESEAQIRFRGFASANQTAGFPNCVFTVSGHLVATP